MDIDIIDKEYWSPQQVKSFVSFVQNIIMELYDIDFNVICCSAPPKEKDGYIKTGIHLIWPRHFINCEDALIIRHVLLMRLEKSNFKVQNKWSDVLFVILKIACKF